MSSSETQDGAGTDAAVEQALEHIHQAEQDLGLARADEQRAEDELKGAVEELEQAEHAHPRETEIIVNGRRRIVPNDEVSFEEVLELAFPGPHTDPNVVFSMTYRHAAQHPSAGELAPGGMVKAKTGSVFNVTRTVKS